MGRFVLITEQDWKKQDKESTIYLDGKYWDQPTQLKDIPVDDDGDVSVQAGKARVPAGRHVPIGKLVI